MAYTLIPQPTDQLSVSQGDILNNFTAADTIFSQNHGGFVNNDGTHKFVQMPEQVAAPATIVDQGALYTAVGATSGVTELVFRRENNGVSIPFTEAVFASPGWTRLPSGIIMQWGSAVQAGGTSSSLYNFPIAFPNAALSITGAAQLLPAGNNQDIIFAINISSATQYGVGRKTNFGTQLNFTFLAIGW